MASTPSSISLSRYRPVVLTVCGAAAAFSIYQIYKAYHPSPNPGLRRRPAVHRPRRRRGSRSASPSPTGHDAGTSVPEIVLEDVETVAETDISAQDNTDRPGAGYTELTELLYHIGENRALEAGYVHRGVTCDSCNTHPIRGIRWHCMHCLDYDLCSDCEAQGQHDRTHIFGKIKIPAAALVGSAKLSQPVVYSGYPGSLPPSLPSELKKKLHKNTNFEFETLDALFDQFSCLTTIHAWQDDPTELSSGIDRAGFDKGFFASYLNTPKHNLVYDRYFQFFDGRKDGIIDFEEYVVAVAIHQSQMGNNARLKAIFDGYDLDDDGFVSRKDFLRMLRSYFALQRMIVQDTLEHEEDLSLKAMENHLVSAQPLGAVFKASYDHRGDHERVPDEKRGGEEGEMALQAPMLSEEHLDEEKDRWDVISRYKKIAPGGLKKRWQRRRFYSDEEEGVPPPSEWNDEDQDGQDSEDLLPNGNGKLSPALRQTPEGSRPASPRSRSSSKVRFKDEDDYGFETRSNASSSTRPVAERWGGYEIPPEEQDIGTDILYQITQQALNDLLDELLYDKETQAEQVDETRTERGKWAEQIKAFQEQQKKVHAENSDPLVATADAIQQQSSVDRPTSGEPTADPSLHAFASIGSGVNPSGTDSVNEAVEEVSSSLRRMPTSNVHEQMDAVERQVQEASLEQLLSNSGYSVGVSRVPTYTEPDDFGEGSSSGLLPHLRPSTPDLERFASRVRNSLHRMSSPRTPLFVSESDDVHPILRTPKAQRLEQEPDESRLEFYVYLNTCEAEINARGGEGRISFEEFRRALSGLAGDDLQRNKLGFLEDWIRIGQI